MKRFACIALFALLPGVVFAESATPSLGYTGAPSDHGGQNCSTCHNSFGAANSDPKGSLQVIVNDYSALSQQTIRIIVQHPDANVWGFQITIRAQSTPTASAGTLSLAQVAGPVQVVCDDGSQFGSSNGCLGTPVRQFAEHKIAPRGATGKAYEFDVNWTPPAQEIGRIDIYVAAVAADGDGTANGDHVYTVAKTVQNIGVCNYTTVPTLDSVVNGASFQPPVSSLAMISLMGRNLHLQGYPRTAGLGDYVGNAFPTELGCVSVQAEGPGLANPVLLPIAYVDTNQINAQMPEFAGAGPLTLTIILNPGAPGEKRSSAATLSSLQQYAPAFFVFPNSTSVAAEQAVTGSIVANSSVVAGASPAKSGDIVSLFGTGFGDTNPPVSSGQMASGMASLTGQITVSIGNVTIGGSDILYAGLSPGSISGLYQFNVRIPEGTGSGDVPVSISIGGIQTQAGATIPIQ
jgi:uncharacterized protein (TIGR03437 family)